MATEPLLLWGFADRATPEQIKAVFARHRIPVEFPEESPAWSEPIPGVLFLIHTVHGRYAGPLGAKSEPMPPAVVSKRRQQTEAMIAVLRELGDELGGYGSTTLVLTDDTADSLQSRRRLPVSDLAPYFLLDFPRWTAVTFFKQRERQSPFAEGR